MKNDDANESKKYQPATINGPLIHILFGGIILGSIGFILGFFGPMIFMPEANQGPLLGIFITGPLAFVVGLICGGIVWLVKKFKLKSPKDSQ